MDLNCSNTVALSLSRNGVVLYSKTHNRLIAWDYLLIIAILIVNALIGIYYGFLRAKKNSSQAEYFLGENQLGILPVSMSIMATFFSALTLVCELLYYW